MPKEITDDAVGSMVKAAETATVRLTVQIRRDLHKRLRMAALLRGETLAGMVSTWIAETTSAG